MFHKGFLALVVGALSPVLVFYGCARADSPDLDSTGFNIVGFKLGMTVDEARAALKEYGVNPKISEQRLHYNYTDGVHYNLHTKDFIFYISAYKDMGEGVKRHSDSFNLYFSPPPGEQRVVGITRTAENYISPTTSERYHAALVDKYGPPSEEAGNRQTWYFPAGKVNCIVGGFIPGAQLTMLPAIFKQITRGTYSDQMKNPKAKSLDDCASYLEYRLNGSGSMPASSVSAMMVDVQGWARAEMAANDWVAGLQEQARKALQEKADKPKL